MNLDKETENKILKALKRGGKVRTIAKLAGIHEKSLWYYIRSKTPYGTAYQYGLTFIQNIFEC